MRETVLEWVAREKVVAIVRGAESSVCTRVAEALYAGGIRLMEITYDQRSPESWEDTATAIGQTARRYAGPRPAAGNSLTKSAPAR